MEGSDVERRRTEKLLAGIADFDFGGAPVALVRYHRLQARQRAAMLFELDETVDDLRVQGIDRSQVPRTVVAPQDSPMQHGAHWNLYP